MRFLCITAAVSPHTAKKRITKRSSQLDTRVNGSSIIVVLLLATCTSYERIIFAVLPVNPTQNFPVGIFAFHRVERIYEGTRGYFWDKPRIFPSYFYRDIHKLSDAMFTLMRWECEWEGYICLVLCHIYTLVQTAWDKIRTRVKRHIRLVIHALDLFLSHLELSETCH